MPRLWKWLKSLIVLIIGQRAPAPRAKRAKKWWNRTHAAEVESTGSWYFKRDILDHLDEYHICIKRMKKTDPDGYALYSKIGAAVLSPKTAMQFDLGPVWRIPDQRPSFGCVAILCEPERAKDWFHVKLGYFRRIIRVPPEVEGHTGQVYEVTLFYTKVDEPTKWGRLSTNFYVELFDDGEVGALRCLHPTVQKIYHHDRVGGVSTIRHKAWGYGGFLESDDHDDPPQERACKIFGFIATGYEHASMALRVSATKNKVTAMFGIDLLRTPYFFDDRDATYTNHGAKKKIFHIVRTHARALADGRVVHVKSHFRGEREFEWNGHHVIISMPGHHHTPLTEYHGGAHIYESDEQWPPGMISEAKLGKKISQHLKDDYSHD